jgi:hypothetical protein
MVIERKFLRARLVGTFLGVDDDLFANVDEEWHGDDGTAVERRRLVTTAGGVTLETRISIDNLESVWVRDFTANDLAVPLHDAALHSLLNKLAHGDRRHAKLFKCFHVHEHVIVAIHVSVLHLGLAHLGELKLFTRAKRLFVRVTGEQVAKLGANERGTTTRLDVHELYCRVKSETLVVAL